MCDDVLDPKKLKEEAEYNEYGTKFPVPGFRNLPWHVDASTLPQQLTPRYKAYNAWAAAHGEDIVTEKEHHDPGYSYSAVLGQDAPFETKNIRGGTFTFKPGAQYGVGSHANWEVYIVVAGEGEFYNYDRVVKVAPGSWIVTRPYDVHAIKNTGDTDLITHWFWWNENPDVPNWDAGGLPFMPGECWKGKGDFPDVTPAKQPPDLIGDDRFVHLKKRHK
ncbi:MAG: dimethylsulfonioproprionate lyase family protein [Desulfovibrionales bacterium]|nr:dimethylsulfonioproprionate lyase family protein [Desulfovibrionales bacterium]